MESDRDLSYLEHLANRNPYDDDGMVNLHTHYGYTTEEYFGVPNYPKRIAEIATKAVPTDKRVKALDVGCGTGRSSFELAKSFEKVVGIDFTARLIGVGFRMQENEFLEWVLTEQGDIERHYKVTAEELELTKLQNVYFTAICVILL